MRQNYKDKIIALEEKVEKLEKQQFKLDYPYNYKLGELFYHDWGIIQQTKIDLSPNALLQRINQLAEAIGVELQYAPPVASSAQYKAVKIKKGAK